MKDVHYKIHKVEQYPSALLNTFDMVYPYAFLLKLGDEMLANCSHVSVRSTAGDHEVISHVCDTAKIQQDDVICFHVEAHAGGAHRGVGWLAGGRSRG